MLRHIKVVSKGADVRNQRVLTLAISAMTLLVPGFAFAQRPTEKVGNADAAKSEVVITFNQTPSPELVQFLQSVHGVDRMRPLARISRKELWRLHSATDDIPTLVNGLAAFPEVQRVEPNYMINSTATPNDPLLANQWAMRNSGQ